jgi:AraC-like DNA-binding protein
VVDGQGECLRRGRVCSLVPDSAILLCAREEHQLVDRPRAAMVVFVVYFQGCDGELSSLTKPLAEDPEPDHLPPSRARVVRALLRQMLYEQNSQPFRFEMALQAGLTSVLLHLCRAKRTRSREDFGSMTSAQRVRAALDFVALHYYDHYGLSDVSRMARLSQRHFSDVCRRITGQSYASFVNAVRVQKAQELLAKSEMSVSAVAFEVGYEELSTFYRAFHKVSRMTPSQVRNQRRN